MAFKGNILHTPPVRRPKWYRRQAAMPAPAQLYLHIGGKVLTFDSKEDFKRFAERRLRELRK